LRLLSPGPSERVLDVGAGKGEVAAIVQETGQCEVYVLDPDRKKIETVQRERPNLKACVSGAESIPFEGGFFDKAYSTLAVHHFGDQEKAFGEIARVLKPGGTLVIVDINPRSLLGRLGRFVENVIARAHLKFLNLEELVGMLNREGEYDVKESASRGSGYFVQAMKKPTG
jgi:ubiquinone/menaquinone biosynthesis C-methylase UbiE